MSSYNSLEEYHRIISNKNINKPFSNQHTEVYPRDPMEENLSI
jgi:hypothetical protein